MNPLAALREKGQSVWLDYIRRSLIDGGELGRLVERGVRGLTSNPTIFEKAIAGSTDYDAHLAEILAADVDPDPEAVFERLAVADISRAADIVAPVYESSAGDDGYVSLEVSPRLAHDTTGTIAEAHRLWDLVDRPNLMIKVPATAEGVPAVEELIAASINVNVTLLFSVRHYEAVAAAYLRGLERSADPSNVASVASFFVSRVDTAVDRALEEIGTDRALRLRGKISVANARVAYHRFDELFAGEVVPELFGKGGRPQRVLWASTGTKNPAYSDVRYVEELVGPDTVNTMPPATLEAFEDHGRVRGATITEGVAEAEADLAELAELGIDLDAVTDRLQDEGVAAFADSFDQLLSAIGAKVRRLRAGTARQVLDLGPIAAAVDRRLAAWEGAGFTRRLCAKDPTLWSAEPVPEIGDRLGWLTLPETMVDEAERYAEFAEKVRADGVQTVVLLGMGGSSLAPEVFQRTFGNAAGFPRLVVLDSTHPDAVRRVAASTDLSTALFVVASKSGTTIEPLSFLHYFWDHMDRMTDAPGRHFAGITDPGTLLGDLARERGFRRLFEATPDVGGRYSALTAFGLVPAALIGVDVGRLLDRARTMAEATAFCVPDTLNPGLALGAALGEAARAGRDKATFLVSPSLAALPGWIEQLIAESTGKDDTGILPVADEPAAAPDLYGPDRFFVYLGVAGEPDLEQHTHLAELEAAGHSVARIRLEDHYDLGYEMFHLEVATAAAGAALGIHPFNQPDVELAKQLARRAMTGEGAEAPDEVAAADAEALAKAVQAWMASARAGDYIALQAYLAPDEATTRALAGLRTALRARTRLATTVGFGPRFLHSTGQFHKGGPNTGLFLQLVDRPADDLEVPGTDYSFGELIEAQAVGDYQALRSRDRRVLRVQLGGDVAAGLASVEEVVRD